MVSVAKLRPLVDAWIATFERPEDAYHRLAVTSGLKADSWRKRLSDSVTSHGPTARSRGGTTRGWWSYEALDESDVDELLTAMDATELWRSHLLDSETVAGLTCEDCGRRITDETGYRPLDLFRPDPSSQAGVVWDSTKGKLVIRPGAARAGGRRFRRFDLCRRCAGETLRQRAIGYGRVQVVQGKTKPIHKRANGTRSVNGQKVAIKARERIEPKRGGRPRLLDERQLRDLHAIYLREGVSISDLARGLADGGKIAGTRSGFYQSILYGWRKLGLALRPQGEAQRLAHRRRGRGAERAA